MTTQNSKTNTQAFSKLRSIFFPIHFYELKKILPMSMIFFFILFNYTSVRNIKDALVVSEIGAEALSFIKTYFVAPSAIIFMLLYAKASNFLNNEKLFYFTISPFIIFFGLFAFLIYPNRLFIHPDPATIASWQESVPFFYWIFACFGRWSYVLFYILAELWGSVILSLSFWQFANQITHVSEAKRVYAFFGLVAQFSLIASGTFGEYFSNTRGTLSPGVDPWQISLNWLLGSVVVGGLIIVALYKWIYKYVLTDKRFYDKPEMPGVSKKKQKAGLVESLKVIFTSPYLMLIAMLIIGYGVSVNLVEGLWKNQAGIKYQSSNDLNAFMNRYSTWTGVVSIFVLIIGGNILRMFRWFTAAVITPAIMLLGGVLFFAFILFRGELSEMIAKLSTDPVTLTVFLGAGIIIMIKSTKYALFDLTKEMAYIPLDEEMKVKGKAVVDVVGGRLGKTGGAGFQVLLFQFGGWIIGTKVSYTQIAPYSCTCFVIVCVLWIYAVYALSKKVESANKIAKEE